MILDLFEEVSGARLMCNYMRASAGSCAISQRAGKIGRYLANERRRGRWTNWTGC